MGSGSSSHQPQKPIVDNLDLSRYQGKWYEVARNKNIEFERDCTRATAEYQLQSDGTIRLLNTCYNGNKISLDRMGQKRRDGGTVRRPDEKYQGQLAVRFDRVPFFEGGYLVHWTDYDNYAIVGGSQAQDNYIWILSRKRYVPRADIIWMENWIKYLGYDLSQVYADPSSFRKDLPATQLGQGEPLLFPPGWSR